MNLFFQIALVVVGFGGGLIVVLKYREESEGFATGSLIVLCILGAITALWGASLQLSDSPQILTGKGGPASGWQIMVVGFLVCVLSGYFAVKQTRKNST